MVWHAGDRLKKKIPPRNVAVSFLRLVSAWCYSQNQSTPKPPFVGLNGGFLHGIIQFVIVFKYQLTQRTIFDTSQKVSHLIRPRINAQRPVGALKDVIGFTIWPLTDLYPPNFGGHLTPAQDERKCIAPLHKVIGISSLSLRDAILPPPRLLVFSKQTKLVLAL